MSVDLQTEQLVGQHAALLGTRVHGAFAVDGAHGGHAHMRAVLCTQVARETTEFVRAHNVVVGALVDETDKHTRGCAARSNNN
jgi:hypothetical protein